MHPLNTIDAEHQARMHELDRLLQQHDWFYAAADDAGRRQEGEASWRAIAALAGQIGAPGWRLVHAYRDIHWHPGTGVPYEYDD
jgi:hypothetical protein